MIEIGKKQTLQVVRFKDAGAYLAENADSEQAVLLPKRQVPAEAEVGSLIEVFIYRDSEDRLIATTEEPALQVGEFAKLKVLQVTKIGAFLAWGLSKDLLLPFKEQRGELKPGMEVMVSLYVDRTGRLCATMHVDRFLSDQSPYQNGDKVSGTVYGYREDIGAFVAVDDKYLALIPRQEIYEDIQIGDHVSARITRVREDGRLDLSIRKKAYAQMNDDGSVILDHLNQIGGYIGLGDKSSAEFIKAEFHLSKSAFKRAAGRLMKEGKVIIEDDSIRLTDKE